MNKKQIESLANKNVVLTGATGGIGQAIAKLLYKAGANLILVARNSEKLKLLKSELVNEHNVSEHYSNKCHEQVTTVVADITIPSDRKALVERLSILPFQVNVLINNAGVNQLKLFEQSDEYDLSNILLTNTLAPMLLTQTLLPVLKSNEHAQIVNVGSTFGSIGFPGYTAYCTSKFALRGFSQSLSRELNDTNVVVKYLSPRATNTKLNSDSAQAMNIELNTATDSPEYVANELIMLMLQAKTERYIGWPERFFVKLNQLFPDLVASSLTKKLAVIKRFAQQGTP